MEYIEKIGSVFYAKKGNVNIDKKRFFDSRKNYLGVNGAHICIPVNDFQIEWISNFGYGSITFGDAYINYKNIFIKNHKSIYTTEQFVDILNFYSNDSNIDKNEIILELANRLAHFRKIIGQTYINGFGNNPLYLNPTQDFEQLNDNIDKYALKKLMKGQKS